MEIGKRMGVALIFNMDRALNNKRPLSPHLQIYKPQLTSLMSISHRFTGVILTIFSLLIPSVLLIISMGPEYYDLFINILNHILIKFIIIGAIFSLAYHLCNGIRHLLWDAGIGLSIKESYLSGYLVLLISLLITITALFNITR